MNEQENEIEVDVTKTDRSAAEAFKTLWDKIRMVVEVVNQLKQEKRLLNDRLSNLEKENNMLRSLTENREQELLHLKEEISNKEQEIKRLKAELIQRANTNDNVSFSPEEREVFKNKIRELIAKINSYL